MRDDSVKEFGQQGGRGGQRGWRKGKRVKTRQLKK